MWLILFSYVQWQLLYIYTYTLALEGGMHAHAYINSNFHKSEYALMPSYQTVRSWWIIVHACICTHNTNQALITKTTVCVKSRACASPVHTQCHTVRWVTARLYSCLILCQCIMAVSFLSNSSAGAPSARRCLTGQVVHRCTYIQQYFKALLDDASWMPIWGGGQLHRCRLQRQSSLKLQHADSLYVAGTYK